jgi:hypothetical protein
MPVSPSSRRSSSPSQLLKPRGEEASMAKGTSQRKEQKKPKKDPAGKKK